MKFRQGRCRSIARPPLRSQFLAALVQNTDLGCELIDRQAQVFHFLPDPAHELGLDHGRSRRLLLSQKFIGSLQRPADYEKQVANMRRYRANFTGRLAGFEFNQVPEPLAGISETLLGGVQLRVTLRRGCASGIVRLMYAIGMDRTGQLGEPSLDLDGLQPGRTRQFEQGEVVGQGGASGWWGAILRSRLRLSYRRSVSSEAFANEQALLR